MRTHGFGTMVELDKDIFFANNAARLQEAGPGKQPCGYEFFSCFRAATACAALVALLKITTETNGILAQKKPRVGVPHEK